MESLRTKFEFEVALERCKGWPPRDRAAAIQLDQMQRWTNGEHRTLAEYFRVLPWEDIDEDDLLKLVYAEVLLRESSGGAPDPGEYQELFTPLADRLKALLEAHHRIRCGTSPPSGQVGELDEWVRARLLTFQAAISTCDRQESVLASVVNDLALRVGSTELKPGAQPLPGYVLNRRLGRGGFGEVWSATGPGGFAQALKFVPLGTSTGETELRSLEIIRSLRHVNLLTVFGAWQEHGMLIIAMELADRTTWERLREFKGLGAAGIPRRELLRYSRDAATVLDFLNKPRHFLGGRRPVGIQHSDIKPQNLLLFGEALKVGDFGLVHVRKGEGAAYAGGLTAAYAPPEFFEGRSSRHSDQYCLAVTYCQLRGGALPFRGRTLRELRDAHLRHEPDLSMLPEEERPILRRALAKAPQDRWPNCRTFIKALADAAAGRPSRTAGPSDETLGEMREVPERSIPALPFREERARDENYAAPETGEDLEPAVAGPRPSPDDRPARNASENRAGAAEGGEVVGGHYELVTRVRTGDFGEVWEAIDTSGGFRKVLRIIARSSGLPDFESEMAILELIQKLNHPHVVRAEEVFVDRDRLVVVMEVGKDSLRQVLENRKRFGSELPGEELLAWIRQAAGAIDYLHAQGIFHRDIKPDNIVLVDGIAKVDGFSLAKWAERGRPSTRVDFAGTPAYCSPETWKARVTAGSDQYSLAVTYAELRLGRNVFRGATIYEFMVEHLQGQPNLDPLPAAEKVVLLKALAKEPEQRFASCGEFVRALEQAVHGRGAVGEGVESMSDLRASRSTPRSAPSDEDSPRSARASSARPSGWRSSGSGPERSPGARSWGTTLPGAPRRARGKLRGRFPVYLALAAGAALFLVFTLMQLGSPHPAREPLPETPSLPFALVASILILVLGALFMWFRRRGRGRRPSAAVLKGADARTIPAGEQSVAVALEADAPRATPAMCRHQPEDASRARLGRNPGARIQWTCIPGHGDSVWSVAFSPCGCLLGSASLDGSAKLWDASPGRESTRLGSGHTEGVTSIAFSPLPQRLVATGGMDGFVRTWNYQGQEQRGLTGHDGTVFSVAFLRTGRELVSGGEDATVRIWDCGAGVERTRWSGHTGRVYCVAASPQQSLCASAGEDGTVRLWDLESAGPTLVLAGHTGPVRGVAFAPEGRLLASAGNDGTLRLWEVGTGTEVRRFTGHTDWARAVAFSPDGRWLLSGSDDETVRLWDVATGHPLASFEGHAWSVLSVAFSLDGRFAVSASDDGTLRSWALEHLRNPPPAPAEHETNL